MPVTFPEGEYSVRIMGDLYPMTDPAVIEGLATSRFGVAQDHDSYADNRLQSLQQMGGQVGATASDINQHLQGSEVSHTSTADRNRSIGNSYMEIAQIFRALQADLTAVAKAVDLAIKAVQNSDLSAFDKTIAIDALIAEARAYILQKVGLAMSDIDARTLDLVGADGTGFTLAQLYSDTPPATGAPGANTGNENAQLNFTQGNSDINTSQSNPNVSEPGSDPGIGAENAAPVTAPQLSAPADQSSAGSSATVMGPLVPQTPQTTPSLGNSIQPSAPNVGTPIQSLSTAVRTDAPAVSTPTTPQAQLNQFSNRFADGLVQGMQTQAPTVPVSPVAATQTLPMDSQGATTPSNVAPAAHSYAMAAPTPVAGIEQAAPVMAAAPPAAAAAPAAPVGSLPAYGADIRPATPVLASASAPPVPSVPSAATSPVASAPTSASSGSGLGQPAVVRQAPVAAPSPTMPAAGEAAFAAATGAVAGELNSEAVEQTRLHRLVESVARQEPGLRWAIGEREDGTTLLVTDVASGWIPPGAEVPVGVDVLQPERRRGDLFSLLGDASLTAGYSPGQYIPAPDTADPINMSTRSLHAPRIDDLGWELGQATNWRDGLPRLAHTLAKAAIADTGILDAEIDMLHQHLSTIRGEIMSTYPDHTGAAVENYMLLAAIDALISGDNRAANYHFAWFRAVSTTSSTP